MIVQLDTENADLNLTAQVTVLTDTPDAANPMLCQGLIFLGDGAKDLDGTGGDFEYTVTIGGVVVEPEPQVVDHSTATRTAIWTKQFPVPANTEVILRVKSPNGADTDVDVTAYLYQVDAVDVVAISADATAANNLEAVLDGTGAVLTLSQLRVNSAAAGGAVDIDNSGGPGIKVDGTTHGAEIAASAGPGVEIDGTTFGLEIDASAGPGAHIGGTTIGLDIDSSAGVGVDIDGDTRGLTINAANGYAVFILSDGGGGTGVVIGGNGIGHGMQITGGISGHGMLIMGGSTAGDGILVYAQTSGDGIEAVGAGGGFDINADIQGALSGNVGGNVVGSVASVVGNVGGNVVGSVASLVGHTVQTGDSFVRLGAPAGVSIAADLLAMMGGGFATLTDSLEAIRNRGDAAWTTGAGGDATLANQTTLLARLTAARAAYLDIAISSRAEPSDVAFTVVVV